jgi:response regulator RpfG family c-di-GMP phosphodiesterase
MINSEQRQDGPTALLVEPRPEHHETLKHVLPEWSLVDASGSSLREEHRAPVSQPDVIIVFSRTHEEERAEEIAQIIRRRREYERTPLLVAITIYQMPLGHNVKKLPRTDFIFMPIERTDLEQRLEEMKPE